MLHGRGDLRPDVASQMLQMRRPMAAMHRLYPTQLHTAMMRRNGLRGLGVLDPGATTGLIAASAVSSAALPALIGGILWAMKKKTGAKVAFVVAGVFAAVGASGGVFAAQKMDKEMAGDL